MAKRPQGRIFAADEGPLTVLVFTLGTDRFALRASAVREVVRAVLIARMPRAPAIVEGAINVRGAVIPVLDIRARFAIAQAPLHQDQHFIVAETRSRPVALRVDRALDLVTVRLEETEPASAVPGAEYVAGIARLPDGILVIHDLDAFLSLDERRKMELALQPDGAPVPRHGIPA